MAAHHYSETTTVEQLNSDLTLVQADVAHALDSLGMADAEYTCLFVRVEDGEYREVWGVKGVPFTQKTAYRLK